MRFCDKHWTEMKEEIDHRGLSQFIAEDGKQVVDHLMREAQGEATVADFEPLMGCHNIIWNAAMQIIGLSLMHPKEDGSHKCPVCELRDYNWIEMAGMSAFAEAERRGLVESGP